METMQFGVHYMLDAYQANPTLLCDKEHLRKILETLPDRMGMYALCTPVVVEVGPNNKKDSGGISGFVMIAESHISFHTFPGRKFVTADVYTCQNELDTEKLTSLFKEYFEFKDCDEYVQKRGLRYPAENIE